MGKPIVSGYEAVILRVLSLGGLNAHRNGVLSG